MSLILEALKKSDAERQRSSTGRQVAALANQSSRFNPIRMTLLLAAIIGSIAVGWQASQQTRDSQALPVVGSNAEIPEPALVTSPSPVSAVAQVEPVVMTDETPLPRQAKAEAPADAHQETPTAEPEMPLLFESIPPVKPTNVDLHPAEIAPITAIRAAESTPGEKGSGTLATFGQLPTELQSKIGKLTLNVHVFGDQPVDRFVLINLRRYQQGDQVNEQLTVSEIRTDGVVLDYAGRLFLLDTHF